MRVSEGQTGVNGRTIVLCSVMKVKSLGVLVGYLSVVSRAWFLAHYAVPV